MGAVEVIAVSGKAENPHTICQRGLSKDKIPGISWVKIDHRYPHNAESISGFPLFQEFQNLPCVDLQVMCAIVDPEGTLCRRDGNWFQEYDSQAIEKCFTIGLEPFDILFINTSAVS